MLKVFPKHHNDWPELEILRKVVMMMKNEFMSIRKTFDKNRQNFTSISSIEFVKHLPVNQTIFQNENGHISRLINTNYAYEISY